jgi:hypothetical protein
MKTKLLSILFFLLPATSHASEIFTESGTDGREITIAEQVRLQSKLAMRALF